MALTSVISNLTAPGPFTTDVLITFVLQPNQGFRIDSPSEVVPKQYTTMAAGDTSWSMALERNNNITPADSYWLVIEAFPESAGGSTTWAIEVGDSDATLQASEVQPSASPTMANYITQAAADARYQAIGAGASNLHFISLTDFGVKGDGITDDSTAVNAACAAAVGKVLIVPPGPGGSYYQCNSPIVVPGSQRWIGTPAGNGTIPKSMFRFAAGVSGIKWGLNNVAQFGGMQDIYCLSQSVVAGTDDGFTNGSHGGTFVNVIMDSFGRDGFTTDTDAAHASAQTNLVVYTGCRGVANIRDNWHQFPATGGGSNITQYLNCDGTNAGGWDCNLGGIAMPKLDTFHSAGGVLGAFKNAANSAMFLQPYSEAANGMQLTATSSNTIIFQGGYAQPLLNDLSSGNYQMLAAGVWSPDFIVGGTPSVPTGAGFFADTAGNIRLGIGATVLKQHIHFNPGPVAFSTTIGASSWSDVTVSIPGSTATGGVMTTSHTVVAHPTADVGAGLALGETIPGSSVVTLRLINFTTSARDTTPRNWYVDGWKH